MEFVSEIDWANLAHLAGIFSAALIFELIRRYRTKKKTHKAHPPHKHRPGHKRGGSTKRRPPDLPEHPAEEPLDAPASKTMRPSSLSKTASMETSLQSSFAAPLRISGPVRF